VILQWKVLPTGRITRPIVFPPADPALGQFIADRIRTWSFPAFEGLWVQTELVLDLETVPPSATPLDVEAPP
jgi:hypothetical protein